MSNAVEFYTISFIERNRKGKITYVDLDINSFFELFEAALLEGTTELLREINFKKMLASRIKREKRFIVLPFGKLKEGKVYTKTKEDFEEISSDVFEISSIAYDPNFNIAMKTINKSAPSINNIQEYLNSFIPHDFPYIILFVPII